MGGQYRRCLALLTSSGVLENTRMRYLAAKCLAAAADWEECLTMLGGWDAPELSAEELQVRFMRVGCMALGSENNSMRRV